MELQEKVWVPLDDHDLEIVIDALQIASAIAELRNDRLRSRLTEIIAERFNEVKQRYQDRNIKILEQKYGI